MIAASCGLKPS